MTILFATYGTYGDVHPFLGVALALHDRGHEVTIISNPAYRVMVRAAGLSFVPAGTEDAHRRLLSDPAMWTRDQSYEHLFNHAIRPNVAPMHDAITSLAGTPDAVLLASTLSLGALIAGERLGIPTASVHPYPAPLLFAQNDRFLPAVNEIRAEYGLGALAPERHWWHAPRRVIGLFPDWYAPAEPSWPSGVKLSDFPLYDERGVESMPEAVEKFLDIGAPPIVFTPGSGMWHGGAFFAAAVEACRLLGRRGVLLTRYPHHLPDRLPADIVHFDYAPLGELLPRASAMVHHGGIGTLAQALAAGIPQLLMPMCFDQPNNARRLERLGVARRVAPDQFTGPRVARELAGLLDDQSVHNHCQEIAARMRNSRPCRRACELIEELPALFAPRASTDGGIAVKKVNVVVITYNQAAFIEQCVRSALEQETEFDFDVIVGDDCSTDGTSDILRRLDAEFGPRRLRVLYAEKNMGMMANYRRVWAQAHGQYVAWLEGDDYWTDRTKLQRQSDFLDLHPECILSYTDAMVCFEGTGVEADFRPPIRRNDISGIEEILQDVFIQTSTVMTRNKTIPELPAWADGLTVGDWPYFIHCAMHGKLGRLPGEATTVYRKHAGGIWHSAPVGQRVRSIMTMYDRVNEALEHRYDREIRLLKQQWEIRIHIMDNLFQWLAKAEEYRAQLEESEQQRRTLKRELAKLRASNAQPSAG